MSTIFNTSVNARKHSPGDAKPKLNSPLHPHATKRSKAHGFERTMADITQPMGTSSRLFSRFIHTRPIEMVSDVIGMSILRPNALLAGGALSFMATLVLYLLARNLGYRLSGFESIGAFVLGWLLGLTYDFLKLMITGNRQS